MIVYAESSAILAWLFSEADEARVAALLDSATHIMTSDLTLLECVRNIQRALAMGRLTQTVADGLIARLHSASATWEVLRLLPIILERAKQRFPNEPIRSLDALHVASALHARTAYPSLAVLSLDHRIRKVAEDLGFDVQPN